MLFTLTPKTGFFIARTVLLTLICCFVANAAVSEVDLTYAPAPSKTLTSTAGSLVIQPDGKIIIFGFFHVVNDAPKVRIGRLNSDGTLDNSFAYNASDFYSIDTVVVQADGKIFLAGISFTNAAKVVRLNPNGSVDGSFTNPFTGPNFGNRANAYAVQPDGKLYVMLTSTNSAQLFRLNSDGGIDNSFTPLNYTYPNVLLDMIVLPNGQLLMAGRHPNGPIFRANSDGSKDMSFEAPILTQSQTTDPSTGTSIARQSDGKILFTGYFSFVNGISRQGLTRLNADGTLDLSFPQSGFTYDIARVLSNDKIQVGTTRRFNSDGTPDNTFTQTTALSLVYKWAVDPSDRVVVSGKFTDGGGLYRFARLNIDGSLDLSFNPRVRYAGAVYTIAVQPDGKALVSGDYPLMNGVIRRNFSRLEQNGALDPSFDVGLSFMTPGVIVALPTGKILVGGTGPLARLEPNGTVDASFLATVSSVNAIVIQTDNKILIGGTFASVNGAARKVIARLNSDGTTDATFNPIIDGGSVSSIVVQSNGKIVIGGAFGGVSGIARPNIARLNTDGSVDTSFNAGTIASVNSIAVQPDGQYLVAAANTLTRRNLDGSVDNSFNPTVVTHYAGGPSINSIVLQPDGSVITGGNFYTINGYVRPNLARVSKYGQLDLAFFPNGADGAVKSVVAELSGKVLIGGSFTVVDNVERAGIARLNTVSYHGTVLFDYDGDSKADVSVYRPSNNFWYISRSSDSQFTYQHLGAAGDVAAPADYDGDGKIDIGVYRSATGDFSYVSSLTGTTGGRHWGGAGDIPVPSDFDGDGKADFVIYRPSEGNWYRSNNVTSQWDQKYFGAAGDKPLLGDFDGDGKSDPAIFRPSTGTFWYLSSIDSVHRAIPWGTSTDIPAPADYDGDGKTDAAVYRPSTGFWYIYFSGNGSYSFTQFGISEDKPVAADYDGDGKADIAVYRPSNGTWYMLRSTAGFSAQQFGNSTDVPTPNAFVPPMP